MTPLVDLDTTPIPLPPADHPTRRAFERLPAWMRKVLSTVMSFVDRTGTDIEGDQLTAIPIFDFDAPATLPRLKMTAVYDAGSKSANFELDATNGGAQKVTLGASCSLTDITNLVGPEPTSLYVDLSGGAYTLTLDSGAFDGPQLTFSGDAAAISFVDFGLASGKITAMGNDW